MDCRAEYSGLMLLLFSFELEMVLLPRFDFPFSRIGHSSEELKYISMTFITSPGRSIILLLCDRPISNNARDKHFRILCRGSSGPINLARRPRVPDELHRIPRNVDLHPTDFLSINFKNGFSRFPFYRVVV